MASHSIDIGPPASADPDLFTQTWASNKTDSLVIGKGRAIVIAHAGAGATTVEINGSPYLAGRCQYAIVMPTQDPGNITAGAGIPFPTDVSIGAPDTVIDRINASTFRVAQGAYQISWNVNIIDEAQVRIVSTVGTVSGGVTSTAGRAGATSQLRGECIIGVTSATANIQLQNVTAGVITLSGAGDVGGPLAAQSYLTITRIS